MTDLFTLVHTRGEVRDQTFESSGEAKMAAGRHHRCWISLASDPNIQVATEVWHEGRWHHVSPDQSTYKIIRTPSAIHLADCANLTFEKESNTVSTYDESVARINYLRDRAETVHAKKGKAEARISKLEDNVLNYENELANLATELHRLSAVPEPTDYDLITFTKLYQGTQPYKYAAVRSGSMWYMTGTNNATRGGKTWDQVIKHIRGGERHGTAVMVRLSTTDGSMKARLITVFPI